MGDEREKPLVGSAGRSVSKPTLTGKRCEAADFVGDLGQPAVAADIPPGSRLWNLSGFSGIFFGGMIRKNLYNLGFSERLRGNWSSRMPRGNLTRVGFSMLRPADPTSGGFVLMRRAARRGRFRRATICKPMSKRTWWRQGLPMSLERRPCSGRRCARPRC